MAVEQSLRCTKGVGLILVARVILAALDIMVRAVGTDQGMAPDMVRVDTPQVAAILAVAGIRAVTLTS